MPGLFFLHHHYETRLCVTNAVLVLAAEVSEAPGFRPQQRKQRCETKAFSKRNLGGDEVRLLILRLTSRFGSPRRFDTVSTGPGLVAACRCVAESKKFTGCFEIEMSFFVLFFFWHEIQASKLFVSIIPPPEVQTILLYDIVL